MSKSKIKLSANINWDTSLFTTYSGLEPKDFKSTRRLLGCLDITDKVRLSKKEKAEILALGKELDVVLNRLQPKFNKIFELLANKIEKSR
jgi:hypothetical protein